MSCFQFYTCLVAQSMYPFAEAGSTYKMTVVVEQRISRCVQTLQVCLQTLQPPVSKRYKSVSKCYQRGY